MQNQIEPTLDQAWQQMRGFWLDLIQEIQEEKGSELEDGKRYST